MIITNESDTEEKIIEELQLRMKGVLPPNLWSDKTMYQRFLKARDYDLEKAEVMLKKHVEWRKANQIDDFLDNFEPKEWFLKYIEPTRLGFGKEGELVMHCPLGKQEIDEALKCTTMNGYMKCWIWFIETNLKLLREQSEKTGRNCSQMSFIFDLDQLTLRNASNTSSIDLFMRLINLFQDNYPERLKAVYIINAPGYYMLVYSVVKKIMSAAMVKKIHVFNRNSYQEKLLEVIDADLLPAFLGGNRTDPDGNPRCLSFVGQGGTIPSYHHMTNEDRFFADRTQVNTLIVPKNGKKEVYVDVTENDSLIHWEFYAKGKDIGLGLFQQVTNEDVIEILPIEVYYTPDGKETGFYRCHSAGRYILTFENSQSWINSRVVEYCVSVENPPVS